jgi:hypothetical protein
VRDEHLDDERFLVEWTAQLIHEEDVQAVVASGWSMGKWLQRNSHFSSIPLTRKLDIRSLHDVSIVLDEGRANLDMDDFPLDENSESSP